MPAIKVELPKYDSTREVSALISNTLDEVNDEAKAVIQIYKRLSVNQRRSLILYALKDLTQKEARHRQLAVERSSWEPEIDYVLDDDAEKKFDDKLSKEHAKEVQIERFERVFNDPSVMYGVRFGMVFNSKERTKFKSWCKLEGRDFFDWCRRADAVCIPENLDMFRGDWYPGGVFAYAHMRHMEQICKSVRGLIEETAERIRLEVTAELLGTEFAIGDGRKTTWGRATRKDHEQRIELLQKNAAGNVDAAARHLKAIKMLDENNVRCLNKLPRSKS